MLAIFRLVDLAGEFSDFGQNDHQVQGFVCAIVALDLEAADIPSLFLMRGSQREVS